MSRFFYPRRTSTDAPSTIIRRKSTQTLTFRSSSPALLRRSCLCFLRLQRQFVPHVLWRNAKIVISARSARRPANFGTFNIHPATSARCMMRLAANPTTISVSSDHMLLNELSGISYVSIVSLSLVVCTVMPTHDFSTFRPYATPAHAYRLCSTTLFNFLNPFQGPSLASPHSRFCRLLRLSFDSDIVMACPSAVPQIFLHAPLVQSVSDPEALCAEYLILTLDSPDTAITVCPLVHVHSTVLPRP